MFGSNLYGGVPFAGTDPYSVLINVSELPIVVLEGDSIGEPILIVEDILFIDPLGINPDISDSSTTLESIKLNLLSHPSVSDSTTLTELVDIIQIYDITLFENVAVGDAITDILTNIGDIIVSDSSATSEDTVTELVQEEAVEDDVSVVDQPGFYPDLVIVSELVNINQTQEGAVFDATATSESTQVAVPFIGIEVFDSSATTEFVNLDIPEFEAVFDTATVTELVDINIPQDLPLISDSSTVTELVNLNLVQSSTVFDTSTVSESVSLFVQDYEQVFDSVVTSESVRGLLPIDEGLLIHVNTYDD